MFKLLKWIGVKLLHEHAIIGLENVINGSAAVFVCNHAGAYGPIAMELFFPYQFRTWVIYNTTVKGLCRKHLEKDLFHSRSRMLKPFCLMLSAAVEPACLWVMRKVDAIPVYSGKTKIFETFNISMDALAKGCNIVLFPEKDNVQYTEHVKVFKSGFVHLARKYYNDTGKVLAFYPVYVNRVKKTILIGRPAIYKPKANFADEKERIAKLLMDEMQRCAVL